jgi:Holliday junction resolvase RusA-like endonuclease
MGRQLHREELGQTDSNRNGGAIGLHEGSGAVEALSNRCRTSCSDRGAKGMDKIIFNGRNINRTFVSGECAEDFEGNIQMRITLPGRPITKKNSVQIIQNKRTGKRLVIPSSAYIQYETDCMYFIPGNYRSLNLAVPCNVKCLYYMPTHGKVDLANLIEATTDILKKAGVLFDDNCEIVAGHDGSRCFYSKENPRVEITITPLGENHE